MSENRLYYGKYRGMVLNNVDPMQSGRLLVQVPDVLGLSTSSWAMGSFPVTGKQMGFWAIPQVGTGVWVEFQQGDPNTAIWTGCWRGSSDDVPRDGTSPSLNDPPIVIQSQTQNKIIVSSERDKGIRLETGRANGPFIEITQDSIRLATGSGAVIELKGNKVTINDPALVVE